MHISNVNIWQSVTDTVNIDIANNLKVKYGILIAYLHLTVPIVKIKVKVMNVSTVNIL